MQREDHEGAYDTDPHPGRTFMSHFKRRGRAPSLDPVAGNGLINRRALLGQGIAVAGAMTAGAAGQDRTTADPAGSFAKPSKWEADNALDRQ